MIATDPILYNEWHVVATVQDCQPGKIVNVRLLGEDLVLWHPHDPKSPILAWQDYCPHRGACLSLGEVVDNTLICGYHGWNYDQTGKCVHIPAHPTLEPPAGARIKTYHCQERYGLVWVCLGNPAYDVPLFPEWDDPIYRKVSCGPFHTQTSAFRVIENNLDTSHFPFLHEGFLGDRNYAEMKDYQVEAQTDGLTISNMQIWISSLDGTAIYDKIAAWLRLSRPLTIYFVTESPMFREVSFITVTPVEEEKNVMWLWLATTYTGMSESELAAYHEKIIRQDIRIIESQRPARLPLLPQKDTLWPAELHVPCDRYAVAYRRWLSKLGVTFGVC